MSYCKTCGSQTHNPYHGLCAQCIDELNQERVRKQRTQRVDCAPYTVIHDPLPFDEGGLKVGVARFAKEDITASIQAGSMPVGMRFRHQRDGKCYQIARVNRAVKLVEM